MLAVIEYQSSTTKMNALSDIPSEKKQRMFFIGQLWLSSEHPLLLHTKLPCLTLVFTIKSTSKHQYLWCFMQHFEEIFIGAKFILLKGYSGKMAVGNSS